MNLPLPHCEDLQCKVIRKEGQLLLGVCLEDYIKWCEEKLSCNGLPECLKERRSVIKCEGNEYILLTDILLHILVGNFMAHFFHTGIKFDSQIFYRNRVEHKICESNLIPVQKEPL